MVSFYNNTLASGAYSSASRFSAAHVAQQQQAYSAAQFGDCGCGDKSRTEAGECPKTPKKAGLLKRIVLLPFKLVAAPFVLAAKAINAAKAHAAAEKAANEACTLDMKALTEETYKAYLKPWVKKDVPSLDTAKLNLANSQDTDIDNGNIKHFLACKANNVTACTYLTNEAYNGQVKRTKALIDAGNAQPYTATIYRFETDDLGQQHLQKALETVRKASDTAKDNSYPVQITPFIPADKDSLGTLVVLMGPERKDVVAH